MYRRGHRTRTRVKVLAAIKSSGRRAQAAPQIPSKIPSKSDLPL
jgi:hypothetical protein